MKRYLSNGVALVATRPGYWESEDGRWVIQTNDYQEECDAPHPMRLTPTLAREIFTAIRERGAYWTQRHYTWEAYVAAVENKRGYQCPGYVEHSADWWVVWDNQSDDYLEADQDPKKTFGEQLARLNRWLDKHAEAATEKVIEALNTLGIKADKVYLYPWR